MNARRLYVELGLTADITRQGILNLREFGTNRVLESVTFLAPGTARGFLLAWQTDHAENLDRLDCPTAAEITKLLNSRNL